MNTDAEYLMWWEKVKDQFVARPARGVHPAAAARAAWLESEKQTRERLTPWLTHHPTCGKIAARRSNLNWQKAEGTCTCGLDAAMGVAESASMCKWCRRRVVAPCATAEAQAICEEPEARAS